MQWIFFESSIHIFSIYLGYVKFILTIFSCSEFLDPARRFARLSSVQLDPVNFQSLLINSRNSFLAELSFCFLHSFLQQFPEPSLPSLLSFCFLDLLILVYVCSQDDIYPEYIHVYIYVYVCIYIYLLYIYIR